MLLALESSCDESALALFEAGRGLTGEWVHTQIAQHQPYGGIVPEVASREHMTNFPLLLEPVLAQLGGTKPEAVAVTTGPGLAGCLALGMALAEALALVWGVPRIPVNHLRGHAWSPFLPVHADGPEDFAERLTGLLPHIGLIVSGGNTILFEIDRERRISVLGSTVDDAAGEALDKGAKLLGMPYPGGPLIEQRARDGDPEAFTFPRPFLDKPDVRFSFAGLKTSLRYTLEKIAPAALDDQMADLCASYQAAVVDTLVGKTRQVLRKNRGRWRSLGLSGGVANNGPLRAAFAGLAERYQLPCLIAERRHTGDNAGMIAFAAWVDPGAQSLAADEPLALDPNWALA